MTFSEALYFHVTNVAADSRVYAVSAPAVDAALSTVVVIAFEGATFTGLGAPSTREALYTITVVSLDHAAAVTLSESLAISLVGFSGIMGGAGGVDVIDIDASESPEEFDPEHSLFARNVALRVTYEF